MLYIVDIHSLESHGFLFIDRVKDGIHVLVAVNGRCIVLIADVHHRLFRKQENRSFVLFGRLFGGKEGGFYVSFRFLRFCAAYLPVE